MKTTASPRPVAALPRPLRRPRRAVQRYADAAHVVLPESDELSDSELAELVRETFRCEVGPPLDSVRIGCLNGLIILSGIVGSNELRQVAEQIVCDEMGLEMIDRVAVSPLAAETYLYARRAAYAGDFARDLGLGAYSGAPLYPFNLNDGDADTYYSPPDRPVAEWE
jgi:hypothetical protein